MHFFKGVFSLQTEETSLLILYLKPKVANVLTKAWVKPAFYEKCLA